MHRLIKTMYLCRSLKIANSILVFLLLSTVLSPVLVESAHSWSHVQEHVCKDNTTDHIHRVQHTCFACDLFITLVYFVQPAPATFDSPLYVPNRLILNSVLPVEFKIVEQSLRGPPPSNV